MPVGAGAAVVTVSPPRVVLDTNVCLDLFLFGDPRCAALRAAIDGMEILPVCRDDTREEWRAVLGYRAFAGDAARGRLADAAFHRQVRPIAPVPLPYGLPRCSDPDDQKFLELAAQAGAAWLVTRDQALLRLDRRLRREGRFAVLEPCHWRPAVA